MGSYKNRGMPLHVLRVGVLLALASCVTTSNNVVDTSKTIGALAQFECRDGVQFSITFNKKNDTANLTFIGHSTPEVMENRKLASGIEYGNDDYAFREHQGVTKLVDLTQDDGVETICRRVRVK